MANQEQKTKKKFYQRWWFWLLVVPFFFSIISASINGGSQTTAPNNDTATKPVEDISLLSEKEQIEKIANSVLDRKNNRGVQLGRKLEVTELKTGGWNVSAEYNAEDNLTEKLFKSGVDSMTSTIYLNLYKSDKDIRSVTIAAYYPLQDRYGNVSDQIIQKSILKKAEAEKVNWDADISSLRLSILPKVWTSLISR